MDAYLSIVMTDADTYVLTLYYMLTDVTVISADCAMTGDCMTFPLRTDKPLWLDGPFPLVDKDYISYSF
jgi:hypothetical protein